MKYLSNNLVINILLVFLIIFTSCLIPNKDESRLNENKSELNTTNPGDSVFKNGNMTTAISTDIEKLGQILNFQTYKPVRVKYKYIYYDNFGKNQRLSVPGPSDYYLEAILYFDSSTFKKITDFEEVVNYKFQSLNKEDFKFDWLDNEIIKELDNSNKNYHGHQDFFFGSANGKSWYLDHKILIKSMTN